MGAGDGPWPYIQERGGARWTSSTNPIEKVHRAEIGRGRRQARVLLTQRQVLDACRWQGVAGLAVLRRGRKRTRGVRQKCLAGLVELGGAVGHDREIRRGRGVFHVIIFVFGQRGSREEGVESTMAMLGIKCHDLTPLPTPPFESQCQALSKQCKICTGRVREWCEVLEKE